MARAGNTFFKFVPPISLRLASRFALLFSCMLAVLLASGDAEAHELGLSRGEYAWQEGKVLVAVTFARRELVASLPWLASSDGASLVVFEEQRDRLGGWLVARLSITADGKPCAGSFDGMRFDGDGVALALAYTCPVDAKELRIEARFVSELGRGHRHLVRLESGNRQSETVATAKSLSFVLRPRGDAQPAKQIGLGTYVRLGVEHIVTGYDHLLFLLGLVLLGRPIRSLVGAITAFTVAHSITLALAAFDVWSPSPRFVEPCIALSIAYVGIENWFVSDARGRWRITFPFGLVHGFGFAGALREIAVPRPQVPMALFGFNLGVEVGQIAVLAVLLPVVLAARKRKLWQRVGMRACTGVVAAIGIVWFFIRVSSAT
jgi:hydrogenase/urease accessory protein HupE